MSAPDLSPALYAALTSAPFASSLASYLGAPAIFTRRPVPSDAPYPMIVAAGDVTVGDQDMIADPVVVIVCDVAVYGQNDTAAHYRTVEGIARGVRDLFHRNRASLNITGWSVLDIVCSGPFVGPTDDDTSAARIVTLTIRLS